MGYVTKSAMKEERKLGMEAADMVGDGRLISKQNALAVVKLNNKLFEQVDEYPNDMFCKTMEDWRDNNSTVYSVFWWWRLAHEQASRANEEDPDFKEPQFRVFTITQYLAAPFDFYSWEKDRIHLRPGVEPWITDEKIQEALEHKTIKSWAYVWHWRDIYTEEDEITDRDGLRKAGERKFSHVHIVCEAPGKVTLSQVCRWFDVPPTQVKILRGRGAFNDMLEYLPHESPKALEQGKTHYDYDEIKCSPGLDIADVIRTLQINRIRYGQRAGEMTPADTMRMNVLENGWTMKQCRESDPITYSKIRSTLPPLRLDNLLDADPTPFRFTFYVDGPSGIGKTQFCYFLAQEMYGHVDHPSFSIGGDERVTFDGYDGEPVIIWNDMRAVDFVTRFGANGVFKILDPHPQKEAQQAKHSRVILTNKVNIINGIQPYSEFINGLAGTYTDRNGIRHEAEDDTQAWRRFPLIIRVEPDQLDVLVNMGFIDPENYTVKQILMEKRVRGSIKRIFTQLEGEARAIAINSMTRPVIETANDIIEKHDNKISDPALMPPEFADYGTVITAKELAEQERQKQQARWEEEADLLRQYEDWLEDFASFDNADAIGLEHVPNGWCRCYREPSQPDKWFEVTGVDECNIFDDDKKPDYAGQPLSFEIWRLGYWKEHQKYKPPEWGMQ